MSSAAQSLIESVLALPEDERAIVAEAILASLDDSPVDVDDEAFAQELQCRADEMKKDPSASIPWSDLKDRVQG